MAIVGSHSESSESLVTASPPVYSFVTVLAGRQTIGAVVTGWMPATAEDPVLFHVQHDDGACNSSVRLDVNGYEWFR